MTDSFTTQDLLAELQQFHSPISERREGGITAGEYVPVVKRYQPERTRPWKA